MRAIPEGFTLKLSSHGCGVFGDDPGDCCLLETCAWRCGIEYKTDNPACVESAVLRSMGIFLNDEYALTHGPQLLALVDPLIAADGSLEKEKIRAWMCADWAIRTCLPIALRAVGNVELSVKIESLDEIVNSETWSVASKLVESAAEYAESAAECAKSAAECAKSAAESAAYAAESAAYAAAYAAESAAKYAAESAKCAAKCAAESAAEYAAKIAESGISLLARMAAL